MRILVTGADGFIGKNLRVVLGERGHELLAFTRASSTNALPDLVAGADAVIHLAGANRPPSPDGFLIDNTDLAGHLAAALTQCRGKPVAFASSTQAMLDNPYGASKRAAEEALAKALPASSVAIFRLPNVFGKWSRPFYNSAVATFCHQAARGEPLSINNPASPLSLVYVDDVVASLIAAVEAPLPGLSFPDMTPVYHSSVGEVAGLIESMAKSRPALGVGETGNGLARALYATLLASLPHDSFSYPVPTYGDERGKFVEVIKTPSAGQVSFFTQVPGVERGGHYHHSKSEKFLVVKGRARFRFRHLITKELVEVDASADAPTVVDTIPGWTHDVTNLTNEEMIVLVWASEVFDRARPDTVAAKVMP